jgi:putative glutathione S-transferase
MPGLLNGQWVTGEVADGEIKGGAFEREPTKFRRWLTAGGEPGPAGQLALPAEAGRYQLFVSYFCPWASRALMFRKLKCLEEFIPVSVAEPFIGEDGWIYADGVDTGPQLGRIHYHHQLYTATDPNYSGKVSVPVLWDRQEGRIVNNESADIIRIFNTSFDHLTGNSLDFYPAPLRGEIDRWNALIYDKVNNGVYRAGFAKTQVSYDAAVDTLFETLDRLEARLGENRYIAGEYLTEVDWRLFVTLVRFDAAYHGAFKCNLRRLAEYPQLSNYVRELYQWPGIRETVNLEHIKRGYYAISAINPSHIIPRGPVLDFAAPHDRSRLSGKGIWGSWLRMNPGANIRLA